jgi:glycopeptide antibiotics resistance protein
LLACWILFIVYGTTLPFDFSASRRLVVTRIAHLRAHPIQRGGLLGDVVSNVFFFIPYGYLLGCRRAGRGGSLAASTIFAAATGALLSGTVEVIQLFSPRRTPSFVDVATNTFGAFVGAIVGWVWMRRIWPIASVRIRQALVTRPLAGCAAVAAIGLVIAGIAPAPAAVRRAAALNESPAAKQVAFGSFASKAWGTMDSSLSVRDMLTWVLAGGIFLMAAREKARSSGARRIAVGAAVALAAAACVALAIETLHLALSGRVQSATSIVLNLSAAAVGTGIVGVFSKPGEERRWATPAILIWGVVLIITAWHPWQFQWPQRPYWRLERVVPFWSYFFSRSFEDVADVVGTSLFFMPLGLLLAARSWRQSITGACVIGLLFAFFLEVGQAALPLRTADITDVLSAAAGTGAGVILWRWGVSVRTSSQGSVRYRVPQPTSRGV